MATDGRTGHANSEAAVISGGITINGSIECAGELQINGKITGDVRAVAVFIEVSGSVTGSIVAERVRVAGLVDGEMQVGDLAIEPNGDVRGEIHYGRIKIAAGGFIDGSFARSTADAASRQEQSVKLVPASSTDNPRRMYVDSAIG
ncbi:bactofilin family protein [Sphingomonas oligophenolica]|uniref:Polymer-forming cytoskeletal protein n=1 Tax=Sphingomonas oligophenolica TaxID=301154 RepID=A0A502C722_9SPHN|nr:polymer-forming cytoskeletal protein [Sphingomonas oligophenolica]TPG07496.1 polymer-forming cytoskeletal protein [Sphingomonas oligophenolica]